MKHDQKCRALKMVQASLNNALVTNQPDASGSVMLTRTQVNSALSCINLVLNDKDVATAAEATALSPVDIAQLVLQVLTLILSHLPTDTSGAPTSAPAPTTGASALDTESDLTLAETIMQIIELLLSQLPQIGSPSASEATVKPEGLSAVDIAGLVLSVLQLLLSKFGTPITAPPAKGSTTTASSKSDAPNENTHSVSVQPRVTADSATYAYDSLGRLTSVTLANSDKVVYNYDSVGNRTSVVSTL